MISVDEAYKLINSYKKEFGTEQINLLQSINRTLATDIKADRDFPPFDRVTMDGIAINSQAFTEGNRRFTIEKISAAGSPVQSLENKEFCIEVMTGAMLPINTDVVIPYEQCDIKDGIAEVTVNDIKVFQNVHRQGTDEKQGTILLNKNKRITPAHISVMATVGIHQVEVYKLPSIAVCSTGDELVAVEETPLPHQIRQSNVYFLAADLQKENINTNLYHLPDDKDKIKQHLETILQTHDAILLSGAVSKGKFDFLPVALEELGMKTVFHRIAQRPGKPFLFGAIGEKLVFGFSGNPVSTFVCYHLYCKHWLKESLHQSTKKITAKLSGDVTMQSPLTNHVLIKLKYEAGNCKAEPIFFSTSGDIPSLIQADGIITLPAEKNEYKKGEVFEVTLCR